MRYKRPFPAAVDSFAENELSIVSPTAVKKLGGTGFAQAPGRHRARSSSSSWEKSRQVILERNPDYKWGAAFYEHARPEPRLADRPPLHPECRDPRRRARSGRGRSSRTSRRRSTCGGSADSGKFTTMTGVAAGRAVLAHAQHLARTAAGHQGPPGLHHGGRSSAPVAEPVLRLRQGGLGTDRSLDARLLERRRGVLQVQPGGGRQAPRRGRLEDGRRRDPREGRPAAADLLPDPARARDLGCAAGGAQAGRDRSQSRERHQGEAGRADHRPTSTMSAASAGSTTIRPCMRIPFDSNNIPEPGKFKFNWMRWKNPDLDALLDRRRHRPPRPRSA